jgi:hypothetical protein
LVWISFFKGNDYHRSYFVLESDIEKLDALNARPTARMELASIQPIQQTAGIDEF